MIGLDISARTFDRSNYILINNYKDLVSTFDCEFIKLLVIFNIQGVPEQGYIRIKENIGRTCTDRTN